MSDNVVRVSGPINAAGLEMTLECGKLANLADGAVLVKVGDTTLLSTVCTSKPREGIDFFPLTVDVEERMYAAGKIPGSFFRREGRPGEEAILTCRLTDRPLRPSFPADFRNEVQVIATILGADQVNPHDIASINGASAALTVSGIPFNGPIGAVRLAHHAGEWIAHPTFQEGDNSTFEIVVAGRRLDDGDVAIMMVEAGGTERTWELYEEGAPKITEELIAEGLEVSKQWIGAAIDLQIKLHAEYVLAHGPIADVAYTPNIDYTPEVFAAVSEAAKVDTAAAMAIADKTERNNRLDEIKDELLIGLVGTDEIPGKLAGEGTAVKRAFRSLQKEVTRSRIVNEGIRIDGRGPADLRPLSAETSVLPTSHGDGLFQRGETQVLSVVTLGMPRMEQMLDTITLEDRKRYMHHYNFPPFSTGETGRVGSPKRREIGHGALAERALVPVIPDKLEWPYTLRVVSDVLASNGSTSMASVCGSTLSLMDAGVPIKAPVAGIAMGLVFADGKYTTLTDILGTEDAFGDMDFKVAGTAEFVTALQLDTKIEGIPADVLGAALLQAKEARLKILEVMNAAIAAPREDVRETAPKIVSFEIPVDKIGEVIGPKGKVINTIQQETGADISVQDADGVGVVSIGSKDGAAVREAQRRIELILDPPSAEVGAVYEGRVVNITKFGAFVNILPGRDGLIHISKLGQGKRIDRVEDVLALGDELSVKVDDIDQNGKLSLSLVGDDSDGDGGGSGGGGGNGSGGGAPRAERAPREDRPREDRPPREERSSASSGGGSGRETASFEAFWDGEAQKEFGDLGPADENKGGGDRGGERSGSRRSGRGGSRRGGGGGSRS
jgi:polyribonucleotide nucleotidyltransferase